ncbi:MAG: FliM/FliN family flagellar motor switch protein [Archangium sp.]|nr:FliM/FliN family flagellar motor switch protein [Archangium sp.]
MDETTLITETVPTPAAVKDRSPAANRVRLAPTQKLTRAHLAINARPAVCAALTEASTRVAQKLATQLKSTLTCKASLLPSTIHPFTHLAGRALFLTLEFGGEAVGILELDPLATGAIIGRITGGQEPVGIPTRLSHIEEAALGWVALSTLAELRGEQVFASLSPRLVSLTLDRSEVLHQVDARLRHVAIELALELGETKCLGRLLLPALWVQAKFDAMPHEACASLLEEVATATLPARCLVGSAVLPRAEAAALTCGDVVLFEGLSHHPAGLAGPGRLIGPSFELRGTFTEAGFTLTRAFERPTQESDMSQADPTLPVEVEIELTRLRLPLHQLGNVRPGSVLPLHINAAQQVIVRIGDKAVARAELVEIEGEIGARIISMF